MSIYEGLEEWAEGAHDYLMGRVRQTNTKAVNTDPDRISRIVESEAQDWMQGIDYALDTNLDEDQRQKVRNEIDAVLRRSPTRGREGDELEQGFRTRGMSAEPAELIGQALGRLRERYLAVNQLLQRPEFWTSIGIAPRERIPWKGAPHSTQADGTHVYADGTTVEWIDPEL